MSEPNSAPESTPEPSFTYDTPVAPPAPQAQSAPSAPLAPPAYGERIPGYENAPAYGAPAYAAPPTGRRRRTWDLVLTIILFIVGLVGMGIGLIYAAIFSDTVLLKQVFDEAYRQYGLEGGWNGSVGAAPAVIAISHVLLYLVAVGVGILLLVTRRIAFWVPLTAGVIAAIIFWVSLYSIVLSDPGLIGGLT